MYLIAEIGQAHEGSLGIAHSYIDAVATTGVDAIKFQIHIASAESSQHEPFRTHFSFEDETRFDYWKRMEFTTEQWFGLKKHCDEVGLNFIASPFSNAAVELLEKIGIDKYKIGSGEVNNFLVLDQIASTGKPVLLSSGMSSYSELDKSVEFLLQRNIETAILQCTTSYPTTPENWGLNVISELIERYKLPVGYSDHSGDIFSSLYAAVLGAEIIEFHVVFDKRMFGPDSTSSLTFKQVERLVHGIRQLEIANRNPVDKHDNSAFTSLKNIFEKSLAVNKDLPKGHVLQIDDLEAKKPKGYGIDASMYTTVVGKSLKQPLSQWAFLQEQDIEKSR